MKALLQKELQLSINRFFFLLPFLLGLLMFIPNWIFTIVFMYFFWISVPQIYSSYIGQQDQSFMMMLPITKKEIVQSKLLSLLTLEGLHFLFGLIFGIIHNMIYGSFNWFFDINFAFFGIILGLFAVFNIVFLPLYFKWGRNFGKPVIIAIVITMIYAFIPEFLVFQYQSARNILEGHILNQLIVLGSGVVLLLVFTRITCKLSVKYYEKID
jgi:hypothetical protein